MNLLRLSVRVQVSVMIPKLEASNLYWLKGPTRELLTLNSLARVIEATECLLQSSPSLIVLIILLAREILPLVTT